MPNGAIARKTHASCTAVFKSTLHGFCFSAHLACAGWIGVWREGPIPPRLSRSEFRLPYGSLWAATIRKIPRFEVSQHQVLGADYKHTLIRYFPSEFIGPLPSEAYLPDARTSSSGQPASLRPHPI